MKVIVLKHTGMFPPDYITVCLLELACPVSKEITVMNTTTNIHINLELLTLKAG